MTRAEKIALLSKVLAGQTDELQKIRATRGRRYTTEEQEQQRQYVETLSSTKANQDHARQLFGDYDQGGVPNTACYVLPNGMKLWFS